MQKLALEKKSLAKPIFADYKPLRGLIHEAFELLLEIGLCELWVDDVKRPTAAYLDLDFHLFAGEPNITVAQKISTLPSGAMIVGPDATWEDFIRGCFSQSLKTRTRFAFGPGQWRKADLKRLVRQIPDDYLLMDITNSNYREFVQLSKSFADWDEATQEPSWDGWVGFGVQYRGKFVSGCAGTPISGKLDFEVQTHADFRRQGLASAVSAALILYCLDQGIEPCWDAANPMSAELAQKLGFTGLTPYLVYIAP